MKSLSKISLSIPEEEYHSLPCWSYSLIARYAKEGFSAIANLHEPVKPTPAMEFGSLVDCMLTRPFDLDNEYAICDSQVPPAEKFVLDALANSKVPFEDLDNDAIQKACELKGYQPRWGFDAKYKHLAEYADYYNLLCSGKKLVAKTDWDDAEEIVQALLKNEVTSRFFKEKSTEDKEILYQQQFVVSYKPLGSDEKVKLKIMPDIMVVDHKEKTVQLVDLKTSSLPAWQFKENFLKFRYDIQASLYSDVMDAVLDSEEEYDEYTILPYLFVVISRSDFVPVVFEYDQTDPSQEFGLFWMSAEKTYSYKGWKALLSEILAYEREKAVVPSHIDITKPNNILDILCMQK